MTFSIVAHDPTSGQLGLAVASHVLGVGRGVHHLVPGVGAVASQAAGLYAHGTRILASLGDGASPPAALADSLDRDDESSTRQVIAVDASGSTAAHTGSDCIRFAGHHGGSGFAVAGNILVGPEVLEAMVATADDGFTTTDGGPSLASRLLDVVVAADDTGGDQRGRQSAALFVVGPDDTGDRWSDWVVDVRVDDHPAPLSELARLVALAEVHHEFERAEVALLAGRTGDAMATYETALDRHRDAPEFHVWAAIAMVDAGEPERAQALVQPLHGRTDAGRWEEFTRRLADAGMVSSTVVDTWWSRGAP